MERLFPAKSTAELSQTLSGFTTHCHPSCRRQCRPARSVALCCVTGGPHGKPSEELRLGDLRRCYGRFPGFVPCRGRRGDRGCKRCGGAAGSAAECLTAPNRELPQGQHWYYRLEQGTNRRCWFLRDQAERAPQSASPRVASSQSTSSQSTPSQLFSPRTPPAAKAVSRNAQASHSPVNARAELAAHPAGVEDSGPAVPRSPVFVTTGSAGVNSGAPTEAEATQDASAAPDLSDQPDTMSTTAASPDPMTTDGAPPDAGSNPNAMEPPAKISVSLQVLFMVILGALAFAGLTGSLIHRLARIWRRRHAHLRRRSIWLAVDGARGRSWAGVKADKSLLTPSAEPPAFCPGT